jgi:hypothetical protein
LHEPDGVKAIGSKGVPLLFWNRGEIHQTPVFPAQLRQPHLRIDFIHDRMLGPGFHLFSFPVPTENAISGANAFEISDIERMNIGGASAGV